MQLVHRTPKADTESVVRVAVVADYLEENWPSMDLVADQLVQSINRHNNNTSPGPTMTCHLVRPALPRRFSRQGDTSGLGFTADRLVARFVDYRRHLISARSHFDLFHLSDHSYSHLVHHLPVNRVVVTCHDLDTFRCIWEPKNANRGPLFVAMTRRILSGFQKAAHICCVSAATRDELLSRDLVPPERVSVIPPGVDPILVADVSTCAEMDIGSLFKGGNEIPLLHVGSTIPRKRIEFLLEILAELRIQHPTIRLYRVGGPLTREQQTIAEKLGVAAEISTLPYLTAQQLGAVYRKSAILLQPSASEGFGLPVIEALASGLPVIASDLPVLREVGGQATTFARVGHLAEWVQAVTRLLRERQDNPIAWTARCNACRNHGSQFTWSETAQQTIHVYRRLLSAEAASLKIADRRSIRR